MIMSWERIDESNGVAHKGLTPTPFELLTLIDILGVSGTWLIAGIGKFEEKLEQAISRKVGSLREVQKYAIVQILELEDKHLYPLQIIIEGLAASEHQLPRYSDDVYPE
jgi:hypothetical protein